MRAMTRALAGILIVSLPVMAGCGDNEPQQSSPSPGMTSASEGAPCDRPDVVVHDDAGDRDLRCVDSGSGLAWKVEGKSGTAQGAGSSQAGGGGQADVQQGIASSAEIPAVMENFGFAFAPFDPATGKAGALKITGLRPPKLPATDPNKAALDVRNEYAFLPFGYKEADGLDPQWSFFLPLGTPVISLVTGTVCDVPKLYSNDYSIRVAPDGVKCIEQAKAAVMFETEHVIDPLVKFGDRVTAGQRIATVSNYQSIWADMGMGIVEIGAFYNKPGDSTPWHACPSRFLAPAVRADLLAALQSAMTAWSKEIGKPSMYSKATDPEIGCFTADVND